MESDEEFEIEFSGSERGTSDTDSVSEAMTDQESDSSDVSFSNIRLWREIDVTAALPPAPPRSPFTGTASDFTQNGSLDVMEYVNKIIDDELVNIVVIETNSRCARDENIVGWKDTNRDEIRIFFSVIMLRSIIKKPNYRMYWSKHPLFVTSLFCQLLSYKRFLILRKFCVFFSFLLFTKNNINSFASDLAQNIHLQNILFYVYLFFNKNEYTRDFNITFFQHFLISPLVNNLSNCCLQKSVLMITFKIQQ
jgi:hypothetical protein